MSKNDVVVELDGEEIQDVLNNPDFQKMITSGEFSKLASDPDFVKVLDNKDGIGEFVFQDSDTTKLNEYQKFRIKVY